MPPEKWFGIKSILEPDETVIMDYGFYHLTNKRLIRSRIFRSSFEKISLEHLNISVDRGIVNIFFYPLMLATVLLILDPMLYLFAGMPFTVFLINIALGIGLMTSQYILWHFSRKGAYSFRSDSRKWRLVTNGGPLGGKFVDRVRETLTGDDQLRES